MSAMAAAAAGAMARRLVPRPGGAGAARMAAAGGAAAISALSLLPSASAKETPPPFTLGAPRYDQSTYLGRLRTILEKIEPSSLFVSEAEVRRCQALLDAFAATGAAPPGTSDEELWRARATVDACIHPVSKEVMFAPGRMAAFVPMNVPICFLMLNAHSYPMVLFSHWVNQSYNVVNNYVNRSSLEVDWAGLLKPYGVAVTVSCGIALGLKRAMVAFPGLAKLGLFVPYFAVISAGACNVAFTRIRLARARRLHLLPRRPGAGHVPQRGPPSRAQHGRHALVRPAHLGAARAAGGDAAAAPRRGRSDRGGAAGDHPRGADAGTGTDLRRSARAEPGTPRGPPGRSRAVPASAPRSSAASRWRCRAPWPSSRRNCRCPCRAWSPSSRASLARTAGP
ncbi:unnamed protein product [Prorocentrum cordatum]|uniref:Sideroflexin n=1 Tax=Prorocentrum cordatum TaxID=2364126 RepID=A0ABN9UXL6_9DINO|nr:unnamed protein product [Polarella glacialis]